MEENKTKAQGSEVMRNTAQGLCIAATALHAMPSVVFGKDKDTFNAPEC